MAASLSYDMRCAALNDRAVADMRACRELREENERLRVGCSFRQSLEQVERYAREELGMQPVCAEQLVRIDHTVG